MNFLYILIATTCHIWHDKSMKLETILTLIWIDDQHNLLNLLK